MCIYKPLTIRPRNYAIAGVIALVADAWIMTRFDWPPMVPGLPLAADLALPTITLFAWFFFTMAVVGLAHPDDRFPDMTRLGRLSRRQCFQALALRAVYRVTHRLMTMLIVVSGLLLLPFLAVDLIKLTMAAVAGAGFWATLACRIALGVVTLSICVFLWLECRRKRNWPPGKDHPIWGRGKAHHIHRPTYEPPIVTTMLVSGWILATAPGLDALGYSMTARGLYCLYLIFSAPSMLAIIAGLMTFAFVAMLVLAGFRVRTKQPGAAS